MNRYGRKRTTQIVAIVIAVLILVIVIALAVVLFKTLKKTKSGKAKADISKEVPEAETPSIPVISEIEDTKAIETADDAGTADNAEAQDEVSEEPESEPKKTVTVTGDNVRMRAEPNTDCDIVRTCKKGETYDLIEVTGEWTGLDYEGRECYIKSEFLEEVTETADAGTSEPQQEQTQEQVKDPAEEEPAQGDTDNGNKEPDDKDKKVIADNMVEVTCKDGKAMFTKAEYDYFVATWSYTGMADEMMTHHTADELHKLYKNTH